MIKRKLFSKWTISLVLTTVFAFFILSLSYGEDNFYRDLMSKTFALHLQQKYGEEEQLLKEGLKKSETDNKKGYVAYCLSMLIEIYKQQNRYNEAEKFCERYLETLNLIKAEDSNLEDYDFADVWKSFGEVNFALGKYSEAEQYFNKLINVTEKKFGHNSTKLIEPLMSLEGVYRATGRNAEEIHKRIDDVTSGAIQQIGGQKAAEEKMRQLSPELHNSYEKIMEQYKKGSQKLEK